MSISVELREDGVELEVDGGEVFLTFREAKALADLINAAVDTSEVQKGAEEELREARERFRAVRGAR